METPQIDQTQAAPENSHASQAGLYVSLVSALGIIAMIILLAFHLNLVESPPDLTVAEKFGIKCTDQQCELQKALLIMEDNAQSHRASHVKSALSARLMTYVLAEIIALVMIVLGGMLIFNRIQSNDEGLNVEIGKSGIKPARSFFLTTAFPGVLLCFFGSATLISAMFIPTTEGASISWKDVPVFHRDPNESISFPQVEDNGEISASEIPEEYRTTPEKP